MERISNAAIQRARARERCPRCRLLEEFRAWLYGDGFDRDRATL